MGLGSAEPCLVLAILALLVLSVDIAWDFGAVFDSVGAVIVVTFAFSCW